MSAGPRYQIVDGMRMPLGFSAEALVSGRQLRPRAGDMFVASYPKCGTTWVQHIVYLLLNDGEPLPAGQPLNDVFPHLEEVGRELAEALPEPRLIKTHLPLAMAPFSEAAKYVYVARNPFDCAVSFYHHTRGFVKHYDFADGSFDDYFECFVRGDVDFGDYFDNLIPWYELRHAENVCFLTYEALKADAASEIKGIGAFLGGAAAAVIDDTELLGRVLKHSSFEHMSRDQQRWSSARPDSMPPFVRSGKVGDWQSLFSDSQLERLLARVDEHLGAAAEDLWPETIERVRQRLDGRAR